MESEIHQELTRRAAHDSDWAGYLLLLNACQELVKEAPQSVEQLNTVNQQDLLEQALAKLGEAITNVIPYDEFYFYLPRKARIS